MIVFYDIPSVLPGKAWSPNTWKVRLILNYKNIPHRTEWIEYPDIESHNKSLSIKPTGIKADGTPRYTLPAIYDPSTNTYLADSFLIAEYLEETYPDTPTIFPHETRSLQHAFQFSFAQTLGQVRLFTIPTAWLWLGQRSKEFYRFHRELEAGRTLEEMLPVGTERVVKWAKFREAMNTVNESLAKTDAKGPFVMGDTISWADIFLSAYLIYFKLIWGEDSREWKDIASWNGGRWENILRALGNQTIN